METTGPSWFLLPAELRIMILEQLVETVQQDGVTLAPYAAIHSEWQAVIEPATLRSLTFTSERLQSFDFLDMVDRARKLGLVQHIKLSIRLPEYDCSRCEEEMDQGEWDAMGDALWVSFAASLEFLSEWERTGPLSLDITVQSPSDTCHHFRNTDFDGQQQDAATSPAIHDPHHGWKNNRRVAMPPMASIDRLWEYMSFDPSIWEELDQVTAVTSLSLRRQTTRRWSHDGITELLKHFVDLKEFQWEPWSGWGPEKIAEIDNDVLPQILDALPAAGSALSRITLFEDFSEPLLNAVVPRPTIRVPDGQVSRDLARASAKLHRLEHLSAAFLADASDFLPAVVATASPSWWIKLASLALTSQWLIPEQRAERVSNLFELAADAASLLPALRTLEVWNGRQGLASLFQYRAAPRRAAYTGRQGEVLRNARITWRATWDVVLEDRVVCAWEKVACKRDRSVELEIVKEVLGAGVAVDIKSHGDAIRHLGMAAAVVHPISLSQIQRENRYEVVELE